jgi:hypothetical protein
LVRHGVQQFFPLVWFSIAAGGSQVVLLTL